VRPDPTDRRNAVHRARLGLTVILAGMVLLALVQIGLLIRGIAQSWPA